MPLGRQGPLAKALTSGIGMTPEYRAQSKARKEREAQEQAQQAQAGQTDQTHLHPPEANQLEESSGEEDDEEIAQELDEVQGDRSAESDPKETVDDIVKAFTTANPPPPYSASDNANHLELPVILPQRRPGMRTRGFIRGYAPELAARHITQDAWLDFLNGFEKALGKNRLFHVANFAVWLFDKIYLLSMGISLTVRLVSMTLHIIFESGRRGYIHSKQNGYLDKMNDEYFKPRGLYALIVKYKPKKKDDEVVQPMELVDIQTNIVQMVDKRQGEESKFWKGLMKASAGKVTHEEEIPDFAPLVFPYLDDLDEAQKKSAMKKGGAFLTDYYDRQAQAKFNQDHGDSKLASAQPPPEFSSEYADPSNPKSQGGLINTLSGGHVKLPGEMILNRRRDKAAKGGRLGILNNRQGIVSSRRAEHGYGQGDPEKVQLTTDRVAARKRNRPMKKLLRQDALYLMVVDLPTQEEMDAVRRAVESLADEP